MLQCNIIMAAQHNALTISECLVKSGDAFSTEKPTFPVDRTPLDTLGTGAHCSVRFGQRRSWGNLAFAMWNTGTVTLTAGSGATARDTKAGVATRYKVGSLLVVKNADGASAEYLLGGDAA